jgi:para-aminobenzoate synthetase component 1
MLQTTIKLDNIAAFKYKALAWANRFPVFLVFDSNNYQQDKYAKYDWELFVDAIASVTPSENYFESVAEFQKQSNEMIVGFFGYECKDEIFKVPAQDHAEKSLPNCFFFKPRYRFSLKGNTLTINRNYPEAYEMMEQINLQEEERNPNINPIIFTELTTKELYCKNVNHIRQCIENGDFYELNYCTEVKAKQVTINPISIFLKLMELSAAPFSVFLKYYNQYTISASPERFMCKRGNRLISQPIKGTMRRSNDDKEDEQFKQALLLSEKERAENVMIVDLVRNDLTPFAISGSIKVEELFGIYTFKTVHQMVSTISCELQHEADAIAAMRNAFPMGSMTGAPKFEVIKKIQQLEQKPRGLFSGTIGYFDADGDFDFNVVIRTIFYDAAAKEIVIKTGSAITYDSNAADEYEELALKRAVLLDVLNGRLEVQG